VWAGNPKGELQEVCQRRWRSNPHYSVIRREGPAHAMMFIIEVVLPSGGRARGRGRNKQTAEAQAAQAALRMVDRR
jgi:ribonuclease-3